MTENINVALQTLKRALEVNDKAPTIIPESALEQQFHGLNLHQLTQLTDAPALAVVSRARARDGAQVERFSVDGNDEQRRTLLAQQLLLDGDLSSNPGGTREVHLRTDGGTGEILVRDRNDTIYRVTDREAVIDEELTEILQRRHEPGRAEPASPRPVVIEDGHAFTGMVGEILHGLAALRLRNSIPVQEMRKLIEDTGERDLESAVVAADSEMLVKAFEQILLASNQIEQLSDGITERTQALLRGAESADRVASGTETAITHPPRATTQDETEEADSSPLTREPF